MTDIDTQKFLHVKLKNIGLLHIARLMLTQNVVSNAEGANEDSGDEDENRTGKKRCRRTKERRIGHVIEKVILKIFTGRGGEEGGHFQEEFGRLSLPDKTGPSLRVQLQRALQRKSGNFEGLRAAAEEDNEQGRAEGAKKKDKADAERLMMWDHCSTLLKLFIRIIPQI